MAQDAWQNWPLRYYLLKSLVEAVPRYRASFHPETGRFGNESWMCRYQNVIFPLAAANCPARNSARTRLGFRIACIAYNIMVAVRTAWPDEELSNAKANRVRFAILNVTGCFSRDRRKITLNLSGPREFEIPWVTMQQ